MGVFVCHLLVLLPLTLSSAWAGNLQITNLQRGVINYAAGTSEVKFDLSWENSWRLNSAPGNWDAVWLFVKYRKNGGAWQHASLENTGACSASGDDGFDGFGEYGVWGWWV
jgi:hypothetical protein